MINHTTSRPESLAQNPDCPSVAMIIVGPPGAGKTTISTLLSDLGAITEHVGSEPVGQDTVHELVADAREESPHISCFDGITSQESVDRIADVADTHLVVRVDVPNDVDRRKRYVDQEMERLTEDRDVISRDSLQEIYTLLERREQLEEPYPRHHVTILNDDETETTELIVRLDEISDVIQPTCTCTCE